MQQTIKIKHQKTDLYQDLINDLEQTERRNCAKQPKQSLRSIPRETKVNHETSHQQRNISYFSAV